MITERSVQIAVKNVGLDFKDHLIFTEHPSLGQRMKNGTQSSDLPSKQRNAYVKEFNKDRGSAHLPLKIWD